MTDRINKIIKLYKINSSKFADEIGVQRSSISHVLSGRNKPSLDFIQKLLKAYPEINSDWLILGKGKMLAEDATDDLFGNILDEETADKPENLQKVEVVEKPPTPPQEDIKQMTDNQRAKPSSAQLNSKQVSKIVIFYTDKTFKEYLPED